jgi:carbamate kinase
MRIVVALGGNALLRRRETPTAENQRRNVSRAAEALAPLAREHQLIITHGNGPQVGLLALQGAAGATGGGLPLDILDAETEGMIGYLIEQELTGRLPAGQQCATLLTQIEVDPEDPAFDSPSKPIGPVYDSEQAGRLARERGWAIGRDGEHYRRIVASPRPRRILELGVIGLLVDQGVIVICAGGGGIPVVRRADDSLIGVEAVIDKDAASALLASELGAGALLMLTDVDAVYLDWGKTQARPLYQVSVAEIREQVFAPGSMAPKVEAACDFLERGGGLVGIGALTDAQAILRGEAGTRIRP